MNAPWPEERVSAVAPDAAALSAARGLADRWRDTGWSQALVWGRCRGSSATPYTTVVDVSRPSYRCDCPSRKVPCKHALSLLLRWSQGAVPEVAQAPEFALAARPAVRAPRSAKSGTPDPATAAQRRQRVTAGLEELDIWLADQVRTGLAQADRSYGAFEAIAARMVDAQAPAVASRLRRLAGTARADADWPRRVLAEYAALHLLVAAHRRLDELPEGLRAAVRTHIGYPMPAERVRAEPAVRDRWMTLGTRVSEEDRLHTRRTWLLGRRTRRWAQLVEHSFGAPTFPVTAPPPGLMVEADVHFYPGAAPLRVLWGARHGTEEPFTTLPAPDETGGCPAALADYAAALAADPWLRSWPVLVREVVPVAEEDVRAVVDSTGAALPLVDFARPWRLLGISGGHPVTVVGEWTPDGLIPISVFALGEIHAADDADAPPEPLRVTETAPAPDDLTSVALLGTARRAPDPASLPAPVAAVAARLTVDPPLTVLESAALREVYHRAGRLPGTATPPAPAPDDPRPLLPRRAAQRLSDMLRARSPFLPEWFAAAAPHDYRAPEALSAQLLEVAVVDPGLRGPLLRLAGTRGRWLARRNPAWRELPGAEPDHTDASADTWLFGTQARRRAWLADLRRRDPAAALDRLSAAWPKEPGSSRADLLAVLADGLAERDEPLLESALDDRRAEVRRTAVGLLTRLPSSRFAGRMRARAAAWVRVADTRLDIRVPEDLDDAARRDGITDRTVEFSYRWNGVPDVGAGRLRQVVAATPLSHWTGLFGDPRAALRVTVADRYRQPLFDGWLDAALHQRDPDWAAALFAGGVPSDTALLRRRELFALLPPGDRVRHLQRLDSSWLSELEALLPAMEHPWPRALGEHVILLLLERARIAAQGRGAHGTGPAAHRSLLTAAATHLPVDLTGALAAAAGRCADPSWQRAFDQLADDLTHRSMMLEELQ